MTRTEFLGLEFDTLDLNGTIDWLSARGPDDQFAYVVTPNVDHMVRIESGDVQVDTYRGADLCLCDSRILSKLAGGCGVVLPVVPGSDLTAALFARVLRPADRVALIGGEEGDAAKLRDLHPALDIVQYEPPMGLRRNAEARSACVDFAARAGARIVLLAVGSPQQEMIASEMKQSGAVRGTALCIGASVDFLTGTQVRAPALVQKLSLEWAWRLGTQPRRLWRRYLVDGPAIFPAVWRWRRERRRKAA